MRAHGGLWVAHSPSPGQCQRQAGAPSEKALRPGRRGRGERVVASPARRSCGWRAVPERPGEGSALSTQQECGGCPTLRRGAVPTRCGRRPPAPLPGAQPSVGLGRDLLEQLSPGPAVWAGAPGWVWCRWSSKRGRDPGPGQGEPTPLSVLTLRTVFTWFHFPAAPQGTRREGWGPLGLGLEGAV